MTGVTVSTGGEIKLPKDVLDHLAVKPGHKVAIEKLPNGVVSLRAAPSGDVSRFFGSLTRDGQQPITVDEMHDVGPADWAGGM
jgi:bifunctional DNA-binding transcriptional regulator/antitoxin component of YhaV-PrlF toxin-antitoxin module